MLPEIILTHRVERGSEPDAPSGGVDLPVLALPFERRQIGRQRVTLSNGAEAGLKLPRGMVLREGDLLKSEDGHQVRVQAAPELVSLVHCETAQALARAAYHLGNRHVWVQVGQDWLSYLHDHVLDEMLVGLGLKVGSQYAPFEPEAGAYSATGVHTHGAHGAGHSHEH